MYPYNRPLALQPLPMSAVERILTIAPKLITSNIDVSRSRSNQDSRLAQVLNVLPTGTCPAVINSVLVSANSTFTKHNSDHFDCDSNPEQPGSSWWSLDSVVHRLLRTTRGTLTGNPHILRHLNRLASLALAHPTSFGRNLLWAVCDQGHLFVLKWFLDVRATRAFVCDHPEVVLSGASHGGHVVVLDFWKGRYWPVEYTEAIARNIGHGGHVRVLQWWDRCGLEVFGPENGERDCVDDVFDADCMFGVALQQGHIAMLEWLYNKYRDFIPDDDIERGMFWSSIRHWRLASELGRVKVLEFALEKKFEFPDWTWLDVDLGEHLPMDVASKEGNLDVLDWWALRGAPKCLPYSHLALEMASAAGRVDVLDWWLKSGLDLAFTPKVVPLALNNGHSQIVQWWHSCALYKQVSCGMMYEQTYEHLIPRHPITLASFGRLEWLGMYWSARKNHPSTPDFVLNAVHRVIIEHGHLHILQAYEHHDLFQPIYSEPLRRWDGKFHNLTVFTLAAKSGQLGILQWWLRRYHARHFDGAAGQSADNLALQASLWRQCVENAVEGDQAQVVEWVMSVPMAKHLLVNHASNAHAVASVVRKAGKRGSVKCLHVLYMLGMVPAEVDVREWDAEARDWWSVHVSST